MPWRRRQKQVFTAICRELCAPSSPKLFVWSTFPASFIFKFRGQKPEQVLVDILPSPYILICRAEPLWVGQAIDACLYKATYETCTTSTKSAQRSNTYACRCTWTIGSVLSRTLFRYCPPTHPHPPYVFVLAWILCGYSMSIEHIYIRCQGSREI